MTFELERRNLAALLQAISTMTQERVAETLGLDKSTISRLVSSKNKPDDRSDLERFAALLAACNLRAVHMDEVTVDPTELSALRVLARARLTP